MKANAEEIPYLALIKIRRRPDGSNTVNAGVDAFDGRDKPYAILKTVRQDMVSHLKARFARIPIDAGDVFQEVIARGFYGLTGAANLIARNGDGQFLEDVFGIQNRIRVPRQQGSHRPVIRQGCQNSIIPLNS